MKKYKSLIKERVLSVKEGNNGFIKAKITTSTEASSYARNFYHDDISIYESFFCIFLNRSNNSIAYSKISQGGTIGTVIDVKIIAKYAVDVLASGVILIHNHPSGSLKPSEQDFSITRHIKEGLNLLDIKVIDHIILSENSFYSFLDNGLI